MLTQRISKKLLALSVGYICAAYETKRVSD